MSVDESRSAWVSGQLVPWKDANHAVHNGVFEGIRCYETAEGPAVFRLDEHIDHFFDSASLRGIRIPFTRRELKAAVCQIVGANGLTSCYVRPSAQVNGRVETTVVAWSWPFRETSPSEKTLFTIRKGAVTCADVSHPVRDAVLTIARDLGYRIATGGEQSDPADEAFTVDATGEITSVQPGAITDLIQKTFAAATSGRHPQYRQWLHFVDDCMLAGAYNAASCI